MAIRWAAAVEATGTVAARSQGRSRTSKLDPHAVFLRGLIKEKGNHPHWTPGMPIGIGGDGLIAGELPPLPGQQSVEMYACGEGRLV